MDEFKHRYKPTVEQVRFFSAADKAAPQSYWMHISDIADLIACRLINASTIKVFQHKEKFGAACVYCCLASPDRVNELWIEKGNTGKPASNFVRQCFLADAENYRETYRMMLRICPQYYNAIRYSADIPALLCETLQELNELLDSEYYSGWDKNDRDALIAICKFSSKRA